MRPVSANPALTKHAYADGMIDPSVRIEGDEPGEGLRDSLARGDALAGTVGPILRHLLGNQCGAIFGDAILARVRGMASHLAQQLLEAADPDKLDRLANALLDVPVILSHLHAVAIEWQWTEWLEQRFGIDPVVPPLLHEAIASPVAETKSVATRLLAAQARWCQAQRRMQIEVDEMPAEVVQASLHVLRAALADDAQSAEGRVRSAYDEGASRLGLAGRLISGLAHEGRVALDLSYAGPALFVSALAVASAQDRDTLLLSTHGSQMIRLLLAMRSAGLGIGDIARQIFMLHPDAELPRELDVLSAEQAAAVLAQGAF